MSPDSPQLPEALNSADQDFGQEPAGSPVQNCPTSEKEYSWIEIELVDDRGNPVANEPFSIELPSGAVIEKTLDASGCAKFESITAGTCQVTFPCLDLAWWKPPAQDTPPPLQTAEKPAEATLSAVALDYIEIELVDDRGYPVAGEPYTIELPTGEKIQGHLNDMGYARQTGISRGQCKISFPGRDDASWDPAEAATSPPLQKRHKKETVELA